MHSVGFLRQNALVFIIYKLAPLVESIKFKFSAIATSRFLQEVRLGPLVLHALVSRDRIVLLLGRDTFLAWLLGSQVWLD